MRVNEVAERAKSLLFEPGDTLSQRVVWGGFWVFALRIADRVFKLICTIVLARVRFRPGGDYLNGNMRAWALTVMINPRVLDLLGKLLRITL